MNVTSLTEANQEFAKVTLDWDETGQEVRLRRGLVEVQGTMPVLVPHLKLCESGCMNHFVIVDKESNNTTLNKCFIV